MPFVNWTPKMSVGVKACDEDHKILIDLLNRLYEGMTNGDQGKEVLGHVLEELVEYTKFHFAREESFFEQTGYPAIEHKKEHRELLGQTEQLRSRYREGDTAISLETLGLLIDWLTIHIQGADKEYSSHLHAHGIS